MALTIDDLKYKYYMQQLGLQGLTVQDLEYLFFGGGGASNFNKPNIPSDPYAVDTLYTPAPTIETTVWADPGATYQLYASNPAMDAFLPRGATDFQMGAAFPDTLMALPTSRFPHTYASSQAIWSVEFVTDASKIQLYFKYVAAASSYRLKINGKRVTDLPQSTGGITLGSRHLLSIDFGNAAVRRVCLEFAGIPFAGIYVFKPGTLWKPQPYSDRTMVIGDSIAGGSAINTGGGQGTWVPRIADMLGIDDIWTTSIGGTGYVTRNPTPSLNNFLDRIDADLLQYSPKRIILFGGYNDGVANPIAVGQAATQILNLIQSKAPVAKVIMFGPWSPKSPQGTSLNNINTALKTAANTFDVVFADQYNGQINKGSVILQNATGPWITGTGNTSAPAGDGNADIYVGSDAVHPNDAGHKYLADRIYRALLVAGFMG